MAMVMVMRIDGNGDGDDDNDDDSVDNSDDDDSDDDDDDDDDLNNYFDDGDDCSSHKNHWDGCQFKLQTGHNLGCYSRTNSIIVPLVLLLYPQSNDYICNVIPNNDCSIANILYRSKNMVTGTYSTAQK